MSLADRLEQILGVRPISLRHLANGHVGDIFHAEFADGRHAVIKTDDREQPGLELEGRMLRDLGARHVVPVPAVWHSEASLLVMDFIQSGSATPRAEEHAADLLAALHSVQAPRYGYEYDTLIGGLDQPNGWMDSWPRFFSERRLLPMARHAHAEGRIESPMRRRLESLADQLESLLTTPRPPALIHGDLWSGNILGRGDVIVGLIDPALSFSDPEIELAFITLFSTYGPRFFQRYAEHHRLSDDFRSVRRHVYNLYPLLVHVRLFGGGYVGQVDTTLKKLGY